jgi:GNAT superfamily N-acetyltransferase
VLRQRATSRSGSRSSEITGIVTYEEPTPSDHTGSAPYERSPVTPWPSVRHALAVPIRVDASLLDIDWERAKADLASDSFDNGRSPEALRRSFENSQHVVFARDGDHVVGMARLLSDGVCNAYLLDVWTSSSYRRQGVASAMIRYLIERVPGQHIGLQTDDAKGLYRSLGFTPQPEFMSLVVGDWLGNEANH